MGTIRKGILGNVTGKVGTVTGASWNGIDYIRSLPGKRRGAASATQQEQQARFKLAIELIKAFGDLWDTSFTRSSSAVSAKNLATRSVLSGAVIGTYPALSIDYSKVLVSNGDLPNAGSPMASSVIAGRLEFSWTDNTGVGSARGNDQAIVVLYDPTTKLSVYNTAAALRSDGKAVLDARHFAGIAVQTWIGFIRKDGRKSATSFYTGEVKIAPLS